MFQATNQISAWVLLNCLHDLLHRETLPLYIQEISSKIMSAAPLLNHHHTQTTPAMPTRSQNIGNIHGNCSRTTSSSFRHRQCLEEVTVWRDVRCQIIFQSTVLHKGDKQTTSQPAIWNILLRPSSPNPRLNKITKKTIWIGERIQRAQSTWGTEEDAGNQNNGRDIPGNPA